MKSKHLLLSAIFAIALFWEISSATVVKADSFNGASTNSQLTTSVVSWRYLNNIDTNTTHAALYQQL